MNPTKNDIALIKREQLAGYLGGRLVDSIDLGTQIKQAHWNVKGLHFRPLHLMFDEIYEDVEEYTDLIAERMVQLGGTAHGTARHVAKNTGLKEYPIAAADGEAHVAAVSDALAEYGRSIREGIDHTNELGDSDTADILTEISRGVDKWLWMVEAHLPFKG